MGERPPRRVSDSQHCVVAVMDVIYSPNSRKGSSSASPFSISEIFFFEITGSSRQPGWVITVIVGITRDGAGVEGYGGAGAE